MQAVRVQSKASSPEALPQAARLETPPTPTTSPGQALVEIRASGVNQSDAKAILGAMPHAVWPRTPGRDYAGLVVQGPEEWIGKQVWGSGGELGIRRDGAHATHLLLEAAHLSEKPAALTLAEAGSIGVPFITAHEGLREAGPVRPGDIVLITAINGKVGQAAAQIASAAGARVFGVTRHQEPYRGHASRQVTMLPPQDWAAALREATAGHGADIVYNTIGSPFFTEACKAMAIGGRQIFISTIDRAVPFDIFAFYRGRQRFIGIDTLALNSGDCAAILEALRPGFESKALRPFPVTADNTYALGQAAAAYQAVLAGAKERIVIAPAG